MESTMIELVSKALTEDREAQTQLYMLTKHKAYYLALQLLKNPQDAEDVLQDAYITAFTKLSTLDNPEKFQGWLDTIVINRAKDILKKKKPIVFTDMNSSDDEEYEPEIVEKRIEFQPQENLDYQETKRLIQEIINGLSEEQSIAVMLYYYKEMSVAEIAAYSECSVNTIKSRLNYARKSIKSKVEELAKNGTTLYCMPILPFLYWMFRTEAENAVFTSADLLQGIMASTTKAAEEAVKVSAESMHAVAGNSMKGASAIGKLGAISFSTKAGIITLTTILGIGGGVGIYKTLTPQSKFEDSVMNSQTKVEEKIYVDDITEAEAIDEEKILSNEYKDIEMEEKRIEEINKEEKKEPIVDGSTAADTDILSIESKADTEADEESLSAFEIENEDNSDTDETDANYKKLLEHGYKGNLWISNISDIQEKDDYYLLTADVYAPECISEEDYYDISEGLVTSWNIAGINYDVEPMTEADSEWSYSDYKLIHGAEEYFVDISDEQADHDLKDYYDTSSGFNYISPKGYYYIKDLEYHHLLYTLLETNIKMKLSKEADIEMIDSDEYSCYSVNDCIHSIAKGQRGQTFQESSGQIVFDESGMIINFYEDYYE